MEGAVENTVMPNFEIDIQTAYTATYIFCSICDTYRVGFFSSIA